MLCFKNIFIGSESREGMIKQIKQLGFVDHFLAFKTLLYRNSTKCVAFYSIVSSSLLFNTPIPFSQENLSLSNIGRL